jgi:N-acyl-D-glutamate deacylase
MPSIDRRTWCAFLVTSLCIVYSHAAEHYDLVIQSGRVIDPQTKTDMTLNIGVSDGQIRAVTTEPLVGDTTIDANGLVVSPGFIDMHAHGQDLLSNRVQAYDGVTTALELESGVSPVDSWYQSVAQTGRPIHYGASVNWAQCRMSEFLSGLSGDDPEASGADFADPAWQSETATEKQLQSISRCVEKGLDEGALGIGFLLGYAPGTGHKEYFHLTGVAASRGLPTFTHARYLSMLEPQSSFEGIAEIVAAAAGTGAHAHIVHLNSISLRDIADITTMISNAQASGVRVSTEAYPFGAGATNIGAAMFRGPNWRERVGGISATNFDVSGTRLSESEFVRLQAEAPETSIVVHLLDTDVPKDQAILDQAVLFENGVIASDGGGWMLDDNLIDESIWPLPNGAWSHPRSAGTFSKFIRVYVIEQQKLSLLEAIERVSYGPARLLEDSVPQMRKKGRIQVGADADIVIFDLSRIGDNATYEHPGQLSSGFEYVIVSGEALISQGQLDPSKLPGKPIRLIP